MAGIENQIQNVGNNIGREFDELRAQFDIQEVIKRMIKYLIEGACVAVAAFFIPKHKPDIMEVTLIAITAAATFALLDMFAPSIYISAKQGAGLGIGAKLVGWPVVA